jgi:hypothetical protein
MIPEVNVKNRHIDESTIEYQQEFELIQDPENHKTEDEIRTYILNEYLTLYPIYSNERQFINTVFIIKTHKKLVVTVKTFNKSDTLNYN